MPNSGGIEISIRFLLTATTSIALSLASGWAAAMPRREVGSAPNLYFVCLSLVCFFAPFVWLAFGFFQLRLSVKIGGLLCLFPIIAVLILLNLDSMVSVIDLVRKSFKE